MDKQEVYRMIKEQVKIVDYAPRMGFTVIRKGRYFSLKEHDSVIIDPEKNCFWRNSKLGNGNSIGKGGSIIDFLLEFTDRSLHEVLKELSKEIFVEDMAKVPSFEKSKKMISRPTGTLELPPQDSHMHNVYAYLIQTRKIKKNIVQLFVDRKMLYQDTHKNCVFVSYDFHDRTKPVFGCLRGPNCYKPFYGDLSGCDYEKCFFVGNHAKRLYVTESVIEIMSVMSLLEEPLSFDYLALAGVGKADSIQTYLVRDWEAIYLGTNQDEHGREAAEHMERLVKKKRPDIRVVLDLPEGEGSDWNDILRKRQEV